jgi:hypothetical protein
MKRTFKKKGIFAGGRNFIDCPGKSSYNTNKYSIDIESNGARE